MADYYSGSQAESLNHPEQFSEDIVEYDIRHLRKDLTIIRVDPSI